MHSLTIAVSKDGDLDSTIREWSSLIGIVTAIVGNILISFALNIQRFAHIRLGQEQDEKRGVRAKRNRNTGQKSYGTQQSDIAEDRAHFNLTAPVQDGGVTNGHSIPSGEEAAANGQHVGKNDRPISLHSVDDNDTPVEKLEDIDERKTYLRSPYWWIGIVLMVVGEAGNFLAYGFAPASIVSPLGVVALVSNCIIAPYLLKERFRQRDFWGVTVAIAGAVVIVISAKNEEQKMGPDDVWHAITRWEFETYLGITAGLIIILMWASVKYGDRTILIDLGLVGLFGGYTALSTKGVASLLSDTLWRALTFPITYLLVFVLIVSAVAQIRYVNRALQNFDSTQVIPVQFVLFTISVIVGSAVLYQDFKSATGDRMGKFVGGCLLTFLGVYLITSGRTVDTGYESDGDIGVEEAAIDLVDEERYQDEVEVENGGRRMRQSSLSVIFDGIPSKPQLPSPIIEPRTPPPISSRPSRSSSAISPNSSPQREPDFLGNPWKSVEDLPNRPRTLESGTISAPVLPTEAQRPSPAPHPGPSQATPGASRAKSQAHIPTPPTPITPVTPNRPSTLSRRSMAHLTPGPLIAPLSSSLSAVVADEIRKGLDSPSARRRPRLSGIRKSKSRQGIGGSSQDMPTASTPLNASQLPGEAVDTGESHGKGRGRSMTAALGDFFKLNRERFENKGKRRGSGEEDL